MKEDIKYMVQAEKYKAGSSGCLQETYIDPSTIRPCCLIVREWESAVMMDKKDKRLF